MRSRCLSGFTFCFLPLLLHGESVLRVCADPNNLPFSNQQEQGLENKLAGRLAQRLGFRVDYVWYSERKSFVKHTLDEGLCDAVIGLPSNMPGVLTTTPYYRSTYVFLTRQDRGLPVGSLLDPRLHEFRIGLHVVGDDLAPPAYALAQAGITENITGFSLFGAYGETDPPRRLIEAVDNGEVDTAIVWGPFAGYFARSSRHAMTITPVRPTAFAGIPFSYDISVGVRTGNQTLATKLDAALRKEEPYVRQLLKTYGVPTIDEQRDVH